jgi:hypothetical protein
MEQFNLTLAGNIEISIKTRITKDRLVYDVYIEEKNYGTIYPEYGRDKPIVWRSDDNFDPHVIAMIGQLIEDRNHKNL